MRAVGIIHGKQIVETMLGELVSLERVDDFNPQLPQTRSSDEHEQGRNRLHTRCEIPKTVADEIRPGEGVGDFEHENEYTALRHTPANA